MISGRGMSVARSVGATYKAAGPGRYPLEALGRVLYTANQKPHIIKGRVLWGLPCQTRANIRTALDDTQARGFNAVLWYAPVQTNSGVIAAPTSGDGHLPFTHRLSGAAWDGTTWGNANTAPDFTTPNESYWTFIDQTLIDCEHRGLLSLFFPAYLGYDGSQDGLRYAMEANGTTKMEDYGAWIGARYASYPNILWMIGGDYETLTSGESDAHEAWVTGLKSVVKVSSLISGLPGPQRISTDQAEMTDHVTANGSYSFTTETQHHARRAYAYATPAMPSYMVESPYDEAGADGDNSNPNAVQPCRKFAWWGSIGSVGGYLMGNTYTWRGTTSPNWLDHLDTQTDNDCERLNAFIESYTNWYTLRPNGLNGCPTLITAGGGTSTTSSNYVTAALSSDAALLVAYRPPDHSGTTTFDMSVMAGSTLIRFFDPTDGTYTTEGTGISNSGTRVITWPGTNDAGDTDWALVMTA